MGNTLKDAFAQWSSLKGDNETTQNLSAFLEAIQNIKEGFQVAMEDHDAYMIKVEGIPAKFNRIEVSEERMRFGDSFQICFEDFKDNFGEDIIFSKIDYYEVCGTTIIGRINDEIENFPLIHCATEDVCKNILQEFKEYSPESSKLARSFRSALNDVLGMTSNRTGGESGDDGNVDSSLQKEFTYANSHHDNKDNHKEQNPSLPRRNFGGEIDRFMRELPDVKEPEKDDDWDFEK